MKKPYLVVGVFHCCALFLLGCGESQAPVARRTDLDQTSVVPVPVEEAAQPSQVAENATDDSVISDAGLPESSPLPAIEIPDRYSQPTVVTITDPWEGPRPDVPVHSISEEAFLASWRIDLNVTNKPVEEVIQEIARPVEGWNPRIFLAEKSASEPESLDPTVLRQPITLRLEKVSRLEAIEKACQAVGAYPQYGHDREFAGPTKSLITLHLGPRGRKFQAAEATPPAEFVCFAGPVMVEVTKIRQFPPYGTGSVELRMNWLPLPSPMVGLLQGPATSIQSVTVADGEDVLASRAGRSRVIVPTELNVRLETLELKHLLKGVSRLKRISGQLALPLPSSTAVVWLDKLEPGTIASNDEISATLETNTSSPGSWYLRYSVASNRALAGLAAFAYDASGKLIKTDGFGTSWTPNFNEGSGSLNLSEKPRMLAVVVVNEQSTYARDFALANIPLNQHQKQPESLPKLEFGAFPQPVGVEVGELKRDNIFKQVELTFVNHANKDIRELDVLLHYLDSKGKNLRDNPTVIRAKLSDARQPYPILIPAGQTVKLTQTAFFCPDETKQIRVSFQSVIFADLDRWQVEK